MCQPIQAPDGQWYCSLCGRGPEKTYFYARCLVRNPVTADSTPRRAAGEQDHSTTANRLQGPGDYLHEMIKRWTGEDIERGCQCKAWIDRMNAWGPSGCREHLDEIVAHMLSEAKKRGWKLTGMPGAKTVAGLAVRRACRMAEKAAKS